MRQPKLQADLLGSALENLQRGFVRSVGPAVVIAEIMLAAACGLLVARFAWLVIDPGGAVSQSTPILVASNDASSTTTTVRADTALLEQYNPFAAQSGSIADVPEAPETSLNLKLKGVRASGPDGTGVAMILTPDNRMNAFTPGDVVLDGVSLDRIFPDRVTLRKGGKLEALYLVGHDGEFSVLSRPGQPAPHPPRTTAPAIQNGEVALTDLLSSLTIDPVHRNDDFVGYRLGAKGDSAALTKAGIESGDIIIGLDGDPIADVTPAELTSKIASAKPVRVKIDRDGRVLEKTLAPPEAR